MKRRRIELGLKQQEVADRLGIHFNSLQLWERGVGEPGIKQFPEIIRFLGYVPFSQIERNGGLIAYLRQCAGLTQGELAAVIQCNPGTIARWEHGRRGKRTSLAKAIESLWRRLQTVAIEPVVRASVAATLQ